MSFQRQPAGFTVTGRGDFPWDMLRHDRCFPATGEDAAKLPRPDSPTQRAIRMVAMQLCDITIGRWESFGWAVHDISEDWNMPCSEWSVVQEANRRWSVYQGLGYRKGGFQTEAEAQKWMDDYLIEIADDKYRAEVDG